MGVIYVPVTKDLYFADKLAYKIEKDFEFKMDKFVWNNEEFEKKMESLSKDLEAKYGHGNVDEWSQEDQDKFEKLMDEFNTNFEFNIQPMIKNANELMNDESMKALQDEMRILMEEIDINNSELNKSINLNMEGFDEMMKELNEKISDQMKSLDLDILNQIELKSNEMEKLSDELINELEKDD